MKSLRRGLRVKVRCRGCHRGAVIAAEHWRACRLKRMEPLCHWCGDDMRFVQTQQPKR